MVLAALTRQSAALTTQDNQLNDEYQHEQHQEPAHAAVNEHARCPRLLARLRLEIIYFVVDSSDTDTRSVTINDVIHTHSTGFTQQLSTGTTK